MADSKDHGKEAKAGSQAEVDSWGETSDEGHSETGAAAAAEVDLGIVGDDVIVLSKIEEVSMRIPLVMEMLRRNLNPADQLNLELTSYQMWENSAQDWRSKKWVTIVPDKTRIDSVCCFNERFNKDSCVTTSELYSHFELQGGFNDDDKWMINTYPYRKFNLVQQFLHPLKMQKPLFWNVFGRHITHLHMCPLKINRFEDLSAIFKRLLLQTCPVLQELKIHRIKKTNDVGECEEDPVSFEGNHKTPDDIDDERNVNLNLRSVSLTWTDRESAQHLRELLRLTPNLQSLCMGFCYYYITYNPDADVFLAGLAKPTADNNVIRLRKFHIAGNWGSEENCALCKYFEFLKVQNIKCSLAHLSLPVNLTENILSPNFIVVLEHSLETLRTLTLTPYGGENAPRLFYHLSAFKFPNLTKLTVTVNWRRVSAYWLFDINMLSTMPNLEELEVQGFYSACLVIDGRANARYTGRRTQDGVCPKLRKLIFQCVWEMNLEGLRAFKEFFPNLKFLKTNLERGLENQVSLLWKGIRFELWRFLNEVPFF